MQEVLIIVKGKVQGVFFRSSTQSRALELNITGYAKNLPNGDVEILAQGRAPALKSLFDWSKTGPAGARVTDSSIVWREAKNSMTGFQIL